MAKTTLTPNSGIPRGPDRSREAGIRTTPLPISYETEEFAQNLNEDSVGSDEVSGLECTVCHRIEVLADMLTGVSNVLMTGYWIGRYDTRLFKIVFGLKEK